MLLHVDQNNMWVKNQVKCLTYTFNTTINTSAQIHDFQSTGNHIQPQIITSQLNTMLNTIEFVFKAPIGPHSELTEYSIKLNNSNTVRDMMGQIYFIINTAADTCV